MSMRHHHNILRIIFSDLLTFSGLPVNTNFQLLVWALRKEPTAKNSVTDTLSGPRRVTPLLSSAQGLCVGQGRWEPARAAQPAQAPPSARRRRDTGLPWLGPAPASGPGPALPGNSLHRQVKKDFGVSFLLMELFLNTG